MVHVDGDGGSVDEDDNLKDGGSSWIDTRWKLGNRNGCFVGRDGSLVFCRDGGGGLIDGDRSLVNRDGCLIDRDGFLVDRDSCLVFCRDGGGGGLMLNDDDSDLVSSSEDVEMVSL